MTKNDVSDTRISTERLALAKAFHDGPLGADDHEFRADSEQGKWCLAVVDFFASRHPQPVNEPAEPDQWRDLALQFDGHRIECMSMLRYVAAAETPHDVRSRVSEIGAFLAKPPLPGEAVLAQRLEALHQYLSNGVAK